ncbi:hypothetical protein QMP28_03345 [[Clostridium] symbiosum]|uniref:hypothetical protein n=1 Tax=Clostridium symbiosum TaxID=1512 RepID=UPI00331302D8
MKVISQVSDFGLTEGREYEVLEESAGFYKVQLDNGNISYRNGYLFNKGEGGAEDEV